jgi:hypothetical protein
MIVGVVTRALGIVMIVGVVTRALAMTVTTGLLSVTAMTGAVVAKELRVGLTLTATINASPVSAMLT